MEALNPRRSHPSGVALRCVLPLHQQPRRRDCGVLRRRRRRWAAPDHCPRAREPRVNHVPPDGVRGKCGERKRSRWRAGVRRGRGRAEQRARAQRPLAHRLWPRPSSHRARSSHRRHDRGRVSHGRRLRGGLLNESAAGGTALQSGGRECRGRRRGSPRADRCASHRCAAQRRGRHEGIRRSLWGLRSSGQRVQRCAAWIDAPQRGAVGGGGDASRAPLSERCAESARRAIARRNAARRGIVPQTFPAPGVVP